MVEGAGGGPEHGRSRGNAVPVRHQADFIVGHFLFIAAQGEVVPEPVPLLEALHGMPHQLRLVGKVVGAVRIPPADFPLRIPGARRFQRPRAADMDAGAGIGTFFKKGRVPLRAVHSGLVVVFPAEITDAGIGLPPAVFPVHGKSLPLVEVPVQVRQMVKGHLRSLHDSLSVLPGDAQEFPSLHFRREHILVRRGQQPVGAAVPHHAAFQPHGIEQGAFIGHAGKLQRLQPPVIVRMAGQRHGRRGRLHAVNHIIQLLHPEVPHLLVRLPRGRRFQHAALRIRQGRAVLEIPDVAAPHFQHELHARGVLEGNQPHGPLRTPSADDQARSRPAPESAEGTDQEIPQPGRAAGHRVQVGAPGQPRGQFPGGETEPL